MDIYRGLKHSGAPAISYKCHKGINQRFSYNKKTKQIMTKHSKKCFDIKNQYVVQRKCNTRKKSQKWNYKNKHWISAKNKKCLDVMKGQYDSGNIIVYPCHEGANQQFQ